MRITSFINRFRKKISASAVDSPISMGSSMEKRRAERYEQEFDMNLLGSDRRPATEAVRLVNMSTTGLGIESSREFSVGDTLGLRMAFDDGAVLNAQARIRWGRPMGLLSTYGLQMENVGVFDRGRILRALNPRYFGLPEAGNLLLQAAATMLAAYVAVDWITSDPDRISAMLYAFPWLCYGVVAAVGGWVASIRA